MTKGYTLGDLIAAAEACPKTNPVERAGVKDRARKVLAADGGLQATRELTDAEVNEIMGIYEACDPSLCPHAGACSPA